MDGFVEPSMPKLPSLTAIKDDETDEQGHHRSTVDEVGQIMGFGDQRRFTLGTPLPRKTMDKRAERAKPAPHKVLLSAKQKQDIAEAFNAFDVLGTGYMSNIDLRVALRTIGFDARKHHMQKILGLYDPGNTGRICFSDFLSIIDTKLGENDTKEDLMLAFKLFDKEHTGHITFQNLRQIVDELGEAVNDEEIAEMIAEADLDDDGTLNMEEFVHILKKPSLYTDDD